MIHIIPLIPVYIIIFTVTYSFTKNYALSGEFNVIKIISIPFFYFCFAMTLFNHTKSMIVSPGKVESNYEYEIESNKNVSTPSKSDELFCKKCNHSRPKRSHHCKVCNRCILKMDHHCPWVANCVGFYNQKFFYLFLLYATLGDFIACVCLAPQLFDIDSKFNSKTNMTTSELLDPIIIVISVLMAFAMTLSLGFLFSAQTYLIMNNLTTIENHVYKNKKDNPYYTDDIWFNMSIVLGMNSKLEWILPEFTSNPYNNGVSFDKPPSKYESSSLQFQNLESTNNIS